MEELRHYGVLGMKWGVRKDRKKNSSPRKRTATSSSVRRAKIIRGAKTAGKFALATAAFSTLLYGTGKQYVDSGRDIAQPYLASYGSKPYSAAKKEVDRSDWTWADYAWAEVEG